VSGRLGLLLAGAVLAAGSALGGEAPATSTPAPPSQEEPAQPLLDLSEKVPHWAQRQVLGIAVWQYAAAFGFVGIISSRPG